MQIDFVINVFQLKKNPSHVENEIKCLVDEIRKYGAASKVILETCFLGDEEIIQICRWAAGYGADYVKTSTGYGGAGATASAVKLMKKSFNGKIKASGGIRSFDDCLEFIKLGANKIGSSHGVEIVENANNSILKLYNLDGKTFARMIDHTNINPKAVKEGILQTIEEAKQFGFGAVVVRPKFAALVKEQLEGTDIEPSFVVGFSKLIKKTALLKNYDIPLSEKLDEVRQCLE